MEINERQQGDVTVFLVAGSLDSNSSSTLDERIMAALEAGGNKLVLDFSPLDYISSAGLRVINKTAKKLKHTNGKVVACSMPDYIKEVFEIAGFDHFLTIAPSLDEALKAF